MCRFPESVIGDRMIQKDDINLLIGKTIELVCFAQYSAYIHLENQTMLTVQAGFEYIHNGRSQIQQASSAYTESHLMSILENSVTSGKIHPNGDLELTISNGDVLRIYKAPEFESYRISIRGNELIA